MSIYKNFIRLFIISKTLTAESITSLIGLSPNRSWKIGDLRTKTTILKHKNNGWGIEYKSGETEDYKAFDKQLNKLLKKVGPYSKKIKELSSNKKIDQIVLSCVQYINDDANPQFYLKKEMIKKISNLGADIYMDLYVI